MNTIAKNLVSLTILGLAALATGCAEQPTTLTDDNHDKGKNDPVGDPVDKNGNLPEDMVGGEDNTFDHMPTLGAEDDYRDPVEIAKQRAEEGSPEARARMHSCQKLQITAIRNILTDFGVDLGATGNPPSAGQLVTDGTTALGGANYGARTGEDLVWTAAGAAKQFDIFVQASPEIIAAMPGLAQCQVDGAGVEVFTDDGNGNVKCNEAAVTCLIGRPATADHLAICESLVKSASSVDQGKNIAVGLLLAAAHWCE